MINIIIWLVGVALIFVGVLKEIKYFPEDRLSIERGIWFILLGAAAFVIGGIL
jgi:uncharacterized membrane protein HdeD (DUF308 family)